MNLRYLPEHRENALLALELAQKESAHLRYSYRTLFEQPIDVTWVERLAENQEMAEKMGWIESAEEFFSARKLRNLLVHEYMSDTVLFLEALLAAKEATEMLFSVVDAMASEAQSVGLV